MRIFVAVSGQQWLGGLTLQSALLCRELERLGHELAIVSIGTDAPVDQFPYGRVRHGAAVAAGHAVVAGGGVRPEAAGEYVFR